MLNALIEKFGMRRSARPTLSAASGSSTLPTDHLAPAAPPVVPLPAEGHFFPATFAFPANKQTPSTDQGVPQGLQWGLSILFRPTLEGTFLVRLSGFCLDGAKAAAQAIICTDADGVETRFPVTRARPDVLNRLKIPKELQANLLTCGIQHDATVTKALLTLSVQFADQIIELGQLNLVPQVIWGQNDWLFLTGDTNDSLAQFTTSFSPTSQWDHGWSSYFTAFQNLLDTRDFAGVNFVIAPSKEEIFPDYYPYDRAPNGLIDTFVKRFSHHPGFFWPADVVRTQREFCFDKTETHWTDFGARQVGEAILKNWAITPPAIAEHYDFSIERGDLGDKVVPQMILHRPKAKWPNPSQLIFNNYALHHGNIRVWQNEKPHIPETLVIFGGSSSEHLVRYFSAIFARVVYVYSAGAWDPEILDAEQPKYMILQTSQRFLTQPVAPEVDARAVAAQKLDAKKVTLNGDLTAALDKWTEASVQYLRKAGGA